MKNSKVTNVQPNGTWDGNYGLMYKFEISFENGDVGEYSSKNKNQDKFYIGQQTDYEYIDGKFPKVKPVYIKTDNFNKASYNSNKQDDVQKFIVRQSSITRAIEFMNLMNLINPVKYTREQLRQIIFEEAECNEKWVMRSNMQNKAEVKNDDLPF